jgi:hypothetical protein
MKRCLKILVMAALLFASALIAAGSASAVSRDLGCGPSTDQYLSNQTTCWTGTGGTSVTLYSVNGHHSGSWGGCYNGILYNADGTVDSNPDVDEFVSGVSFYYSFGAYETVDFVYHDSTGTGSAYCHA